MTKLKFAKQGMCTCRWKVWGRNCTSWCTQRSPSLRHADWGRFVGLQAGKPGSRGGEQTLRGFNRCYQTKFNVLSSLTVWSASLFVWASFSAFFYTPCYASKINCQRIRPWCLLVSVSFLLLFSIFVSFRYAAFPRPVLCRLWDSTEHITCTTIKIPYVIQIRDIRGPLLSLCLYFLFLISNVFLPSSSPVSLRSPDACISLCLFEISDLVQSELAARSGVWLLYHCWWLFDTLLFWHPRLQPTPHEGSLSQHLSPC